MPMIFHIKPVTAEACIPYEEKFRRVLTRTTLPGDNLEPMGLDHDNIFTIRDNIQCRIFFSFFNYKNEDHLIILEIDKTHQLNCKYRKKAVFDPFMEKNAPIFRETIDHQPVVEVEQPEAVIGYVPVQMMGHHAIVLDDFQAKINIPGIVEGPAGSGKTCVAFRLLEESAGDKVTYVTKSARLTAEIKSFWKESPSFEKSQQNVEILSHQEFLRKIYPGMAISHHAKEAFEGWFKEYLALVGRINITKKPSEKMDSKGECAPVLSGNSPMPEVDTLYQEFRIRSGFKNDQSYKNIGSKHTLFGNMEDREWINRAYAVWMENCRSKNLIFSEFHSFEIPEGFEKFDKIIIDESQDFSHQELLFFYQVVRESQLIFFLDPRQSLFDDNPKSLFLQNEFYRRHEETGTKKADDLVTILHMVYRSAPKIMRLAEVMNNLRIEMTPSNRKKEAEFKVRKGDDGEVIWMDPKKQSSFDEITEMMQDAGVSLITTPDHEKELIKKGFLQVFNIKDMKGLQNDTIILFNVLSEKEYKEINKNITLHDDGSFDVKQKDAKYSSSLAKIFTQITRARKTIYIYQTNPHDVKNIIQLLKKVECDEQSTHGHVKSTDEEWEKKALEQYLEYPEKSLNILRNQLKWTEDRIQAWVIKNFSGSQNAVTSSTMAPVLNHKKRSEFDYRKAFDDHMSNTKKMINFFKNQHEIKKIQESIYRNSDFDTLEKMMIKDGNGCVDWNYRSPDKKTALEVLANACGTKSELLLEFIHVKRLVDLHLVFSDGTSTLMSTLHSHGAIDLAVTILSDRQSFLNKFLESKQPEFIVELLLELYKKSEQHIQDRIEKYFLVFDHPGFISCVEFHRDNKNWDKFTNLISMGCTCGVFGAIVKAMNLHKKLADRESTVELKISNLNNAMMFARMVHVLEPEKLGNELKEISDQLLDLISPKIDSPPHVFDECDYYTSSVFNSNHSNGTSVSIMDFKIFGLSAKNLLTLIRDKKSTDLLFTVTIENSGLTLLMSLFTKFTFDSDDIFDIASLLIKVHQVDVNVFDDSGKTAFYYAGMKDLLREKRFLELFSKANEFSYSLALSRLSADDKHALNKKLRDTLVGTAFLMKEKAKEACMKTIETDQKKERASAAY